MSAGEFQLEVNAECTVFVRAWKPARKARAALQIIHGMAEHSGRYARFAKALNKKGYAVYAHDLPGHGRTARAPDELGHLADTHGWRLALQSIRRVQVCMRENHPDLPRFVFGHSVGALMAQDYIVHHGREVSACVLSSTNGDLGWMRRIAATLMRAESLAGGRRYRSRIAEQLSHKLFNRKFRPNRTEFDWLSADADEVDKYIADPHCGFRMSVGMWAELMVIGGRMRDPHRLARIPGDLPILLLAGSADTATQGLRGANLQEKAYRKAGMSEISLKSYSGARHELLNDTCRDEVTQDIIEWLEPRCIVRPL